MFAKDPEEKIYLRCGGLLKSYAEEIEVRSLEFEVHFNAWFETRPVDECTQGTVVILESCLFC